MREEQRKEEWGQKTSAYDKSKNTLNTLTIKSLWFQNKANIMLKKICVWKDCEIGT